MRQLLRVNSACPAQADNADCHPADDRLSARAEGPNLPIVSLRTDFRHLRVEQGACAGADLPDGDFPRRPQSSRAATLGTYHQGEMVSAGNAPPEIFSQR